jgi:hypothetical protein
MLAEFEKVSQIPGQGFRRWFSDDYFELVVFYPSEAQEEITGFQLCYDIKGDAHVFSWHRDQGYHHNKIDDGEVYGRHKMTPVFVEDGLFDAETALGLFLAASAHIDPEITAIVAHHIQQARHSHG